MQMLGSTIAVIAVAWGLGRVRTKFQIFGSDDDGWRNWFYGWLKWVVPGFMFAVLIGYIVSNL